MEVGMNNLLVLCIIFIALPMWTTGQTKSSVLKTETYNTGLNLNFQPKHKTINTLIYNLRSAYSEFLCLQEVWYEKDLTNLIKGIGYIFPYHFSALHSSVGALTPSEPADNLDNLFNLKDNSCGFQEGVRLGKKVTTCAEANNCNLNLTGADGFGCLAEMCRTELYDSRISPECVSCFYLSSHDKFEGSLAPCAGNADKDNRLNNPGLVIFSKKKLVNAEYMNFHPGKRALVERGYIHAEVEVEWYKKKHVICTHLADGMETYLESNLGFANGRAQQRDEIETLKTVMADMNDVTLLGDFNMGPTTIDERHSEFNLKGFNVDNYNYLLSLGFTSCYHKFVGQCTLCENNHLNKHDGGNQVQSHVLVRGTASCCVHPYHKLVHQPYRTMDGGYRGYRLSDHYGIVVDVCY